MDRYCTEGAHQPLQPAVLELTVKNHPWVMSRICGLFARRAFNLEGIFCVPVHGSAVSRMRLLVGDDGRLDQVMRHLRNLLDVISVERRPPDPAARTPEDLLLCR